MSVYLGPMLGREYSTSGQWPFCQYMQLMADTPKELLDFAKSIGIRRHYWILLKSRIPVYYLPVRRRESIKRLGAKPLDIQGVKLFIRRYLANNK